MDIAKLFDRVSTLESDLSSSEEKRRKNAEALKNAISLIKSQSKKINSLEARLCDLETGSSVEPGNEDLTDYTNETLVYRHADSGNRVVRDAKLVCFNRKNGFATFLLDDGRGFVASRNKWADPRMSFNDLGDGEKGIFHRDNKFEKIMISDKITIEEPKRIKCYVSYRYHNRYHAKYGRHWGDFMHNGVVNAPYIEALIESERQKDDWHTEHNKHGGEKIGMTVELRVLPYYVAQFKKRGRKA